MRSALVLVISMAIALTVMDEPPAAAEEVDFIFEGGGFGHGVGMSQYGAYGMALDGANADEIVSHYYEGTKDQSTGSALEHFATVDAGAEQAEVDRMYSSETPLWVGFAQDRTRLTFRAVGGPLEICQDGKICPVATVPNGETWTIEGNGASCTVFDAGHNAVSTGACTAAITWDTGTSIQLARSYPLNPVSDRTYGYGEIKIRDNRYPEASEPATAFHVVVALPMEDYLRGLGEMPSLWEQEALRAQVIAGRTYAANKYLRYERSDLRIEQSIPAFNAALSSARRADCWCHLYDSIKDQNYVGLSKEQETHGDRWVAAVADTDDQVITFRGVGYEEFTKYGVIEAFYFSSTAGWTNTNVDGFGSSVQYPYLLPVPDPGSQDPAVGNPYAAWESTKSAADLASSLGWDSVTSVDVVQALPGSTVRFTGLSGGVEVTADKKSWWLDNHFLSGQVTAVDGVGPPGPFSDISSSPHAANIIIIWQEGVTQGCAPLLFCPNAPVTRGQMASFLARSLELPEPTIDFFEDDDGSTHEDNINRVAEAGIATGFADGTYRPQDPVRRDHMATFMARALGLEPVAGTVFTDVFGFHEGNINALAGAGVTEGCDDEGPRFCPAEFVTRGQMASFLARAFFIP